MADKKQSKAGPEDTYADDPTVETPEQRVARSREATKSQNEAYGAAGIDFGGIGGGIVTNSPLASGAGGAVVGGSTNTTGGTGTSGASGTSSTSGATGSTT